MKNLCAKVTPGESEMFDAIADKLNMTRSQLIRDRLLEGNDKIHRLLNMPDSVIPHPDDAIKAAAMIEKLQKNYPEKSHSEILIGALNVALENENRKLVSYNLKNYFSK